MAQPPIILKSPTMHCIHETEVLYLCCPPEAESNQGWPSLQELHAGSPSSMGSPATPERSTTRTRKSPRGLTPSQRRHRLAADNLNLDLLKPDNLYPPPTDESPAVSSTSQRPLGHQRRKRPLSLLATTSALFFAALNCRCSRGKSG